MLPIPVFPKRYGRNGRRQLFGFTYVEALVAMLVLAIALVPAMEALRGGIKGVRQDERVDSVTGTVHVLSDGQAAINKMESLLALKSTNISASPSGINTAHSSLSDAAATATSPRCLVYTSWYDTTKTAEADRFVSPKTKLLWVKVAVEGSGVSLTTLVYVP